MLRAGRNISQCPGQEAVSVPTLRAKAFFVKMLRAKSILSENAKGDKQFQCQCSGWIAVSVPMLEERKKVSVPMLGAGCSLGGSGFGANSFSGKQFQC